MGAARGPLGSRHRLQRDRDGAELPAGAEEVVAFRQYRAVGANNVDHLRELVGALAYEVNVQVVSEYKQLLQDRRQPA